MQKFYLLVAGAVVFSAIAGASLASVFRQNASQEQRLLQTNSSQPLSLQTSEDTTSAVVATNSDPKRPTKSTPQPQTKKSVVASQPRLNDFPHQRISLPDEVTPDSEFAQVRQRLRQAVQERDAEFVRSILPADQLGLGFGTLTIAELKLEDPKHHFWGLLEKAIAIGCYQESTEGRSNIEPTAGVWVCNNVTREFYRQYPNPKSASGVEYEISHVVVVGDNVNVRAQPNFNSRLVGLLSNEIVKVNRQIEQQQAQQRQQQNQDFDSINGWTAVILPNNQQGYVSNRYAYSPLEYRAVFGKVKGQWQLLSMPGGE